MSTKLSSRLIGYARVSSNGQELQLQLDALKEVGCSKANVFLDKICRAKADRPGLDKCLQQLTAGDVLVVWRLDRLGRSLKYLIEVMTTLDQRGIGFKSLTEQIDTTTSGGGPEFVSTSGPKLGSPATCVLRVGRPGSIVY